MSQILNKLCFIAFSEIPFQFPPYLKNTNRLGFSFSLVIFCGFCAVVKYCKFKSIVYSLWLPSDHLHKCFAGRGKRVINTPHHTTFPSLYGNECLNLPLWHSADKVINEACCLFSLSKQCVCLCKSSQALDECIHLTIFFQFYDLPHTIDLRMP